MLYRYSIYDIENLNLFILFSSFNFFCLWSLIRTVKLFFLLPFCLKMTIWLVTEGEKVYLPIKFQVSLAAAIV